MQKYYLEARCLLKLATPVLIAQSTQLLISFADTVMAGNVSATDMAAIALAGSIWQPTLLFGQGLVQALTSIIGQLKGARKQQHICHQVWQGFWLAILISVFLISMLYSFGWFIEQMPQRHSVDPKVLQLCLGYLQIVAWGVPGYLLYLVLRCLCEGLGRTKPAMVVGFIALLVNIPINYIAIYGHFGMPSLGGVGCGVATMIVYWVMFLLLLGYVARSPELHDLQIFSRFEWPNFKILRQLVRLGLPIGCSYFFEASLFSMSAVMILPFGIAQVAGHQIAMNVSTLLFVLPFSVGAATTVRISHKLGERSTDQAKDVAYTGLTISLILGVITASLAALWRSQIVSIYNNDLSVLAIASHLMFFVAVYQCPDSIQVVTNSVLRGYNDTSSIFTITFVSYWILGLSCSYVLGFTDWIVPAMAAPGIWCGFIIGITSAAILLIFRMVWVQRLKKVTILERVMGQGN